MLAWVFSTAKSTAESIPTNTLSTTVGVIPAFLLLLVDLHLQQKKTDLLLRAADCVRLIDRLKHCLIYFLIGVDKKN